MNNTVRTTRDAKEDKGSQTVFIEEMVLNLSWTFSGGAGGRKSRAGGISMDAVARGPT